MIHIEDGGWTINHGHGSFDERGFEVELCLSMKVRDDHPRFQELLDSCDGPAEDRQRLFRELILEDDV